MKPMRVQLSRKKGSRTPENTVSVARPTKWGNPYSVKDYGLPLALVLYRETVQGGWSPRNIEQMDDAKAAFTYQLHCAWGKRIGYRAVERAWGELRGKNLACWCALDQPCHADVLLEIANQ